MKNYKGGMIKASLEERRMTKDKITGQITAFYVKRIYDPDYKSTKTRSGASFSTAFYVLPIAPGFVRTNLGNTQTFSHELAHVLLNPGHHVGDSSNLLYKHKRGTAVKLTEDQCDDIRTSAYVK